MSVMITTAPASRGIAIRISGRLEGIALPELLGALDRRPSAVELDLSQLVTADAEAIAFLRRYRAAGAILSGASPYVSLLLDAADGHPALPGAVVGPAAQQQQQQQQPSGRNRSAWRKSRTS